MGTVDPAQCVFLIIEDHLAMRKIIKTVLHAVGVQIIVEAPDGIEGLRQLQRRNKSGELNDRTKPRDHPFNRKIDFILCDWIMPKMTGLEVLQEVKKDPVLKKLPFVMLTAENEKDLVLSALQLGVSDYLVKPFTTEQLEKKLRLMMSEL